MEKLQQENITYVCWARVVSVIVGCILAVMTNTASFLWHEKKLDFVEYICLDLYNKKKGFNFRRLLQRLYVAV